MSDVLTLDRSGDGIRVGGRIGFADAAAALSRAPELAGGQEVDVDLSALRSADGITLAVLLAWEARSLARGMRLRYVAVPPRLRALMHLCDTEALLGLA